MVALAVTLKVLHLTLKLGLRTRNKRTLSFSKNLRLFLSESALIFLGGGRGKRLSFVLGYEHTIDVKNDRYDKGDDIARSAPVDDH